MKLTITIANAATIDASHTISALGLGITRLAIDQVPAQLHLAVILIADLESGERLEHEFEMHVAMAGKSRQQFAVGKFKAGGEREQVILTQSFTMLATAEGAYVFSATCGEAEANVELKVGKNSLQPAEEA